MRISCVLATMTEQYWTCHAVCIQVHTTQTIVPSFNSVPMVLAYRDGRRKLKRIMSQTKVLVIQSAGMEAN